MVERGSDLHSLDMPHNSLIAAASSLSLNEIVEYSHHSFSRSTLPSKLPRLSTGFVIPKSYNTQSSQ